jgi:histidinol-phosphate aminotransferase
MTVPVKFKKHIEEIWRMEPVEATRLGKIRLDKNERISPFPESFWNDALQGITQDIVQACPEVWPLYARLSSAHGLPMSSFLLTAGSDAAIRHCFETFVSPGDKVIYPEPTFAMVTIYGALYGAKMEPIGYDRHLSLRYGDLLAAIDDKTTLIVLANPNSPTGTSIGNDLIEEILKKAMNYRIAVLIDEAYYGFCRFTAAGFIHDYPNIIVTRSFSKIAGMAGLRVGYAMGNREIVSLLTKFRPMYEINAVGVVFAAKILDNWNVALKYGEETIEGRDRFSAFLKECGFLVVDTETNFMHVDFGLHKDEIMKALSDWGILVRGMLDIPGYENYTRISVGPWTAMKPVVDILRYKLDKT